MTVNSLDTIDSVINEFHRIAQSQPNQHISQDELSQLLTFCQKVVTTYMGFQAVFHQRCHCLAMTKDEDTLSVKFLQSVLFTGHALNINPVTLQSMILSSIFMLQHKHLSDSDGAWTQSLVQLTKQLKAPTLGSVKLALLACIRITTANQATPPKLSQRYPAIQYCIESSWQYANANKTLLEVIADTVLDERYRDIQHNHFYHLTSPLWCALGIRLDDQLCFVVGATENAIVVAKIRKPTEHNKSKFSFLLFSPRQFAEAKLNHKNAPFVVWLSAYSTYHKSKVDQPKLSHHRLASQQQAPVELSNILKCLQKPTCEPAEIAELVAKSSLFSTTLQRSAAQLNRLNIAVNDIKQSVLTHGLDRVGAILTEQALWFRLTQSYFPLSQEFVRLCELHRYNVANMALKLDIGMPQQCSLMATLQLSALFTYAPLRSLSTWQPDTLFNSRIPWHDSAVSLADAWHQDSHVVGVLKHLDSTTVPTKYQLHVEILHSSLNLTLHWLYGQTIPKRQSAFPQPINTQQLRSDAAHLIYCAF